MTTRQVTWTEAEREVFSELLDQCRERMSCAGCNDFDLPATPSGQKLADDVARWLAEDADEKPELPGSLCVSDWALMYILCKRIGLEATP